MTSSAQKRLYHPRRITLESLQWSPDWWIKNHLLTATPRIQHHMQTCASWIYRRISLCQDIWRWWKYCLRDIWY
jgi:hypothetical protein